MVNLPFGRMPGSEPQMDVTRNRQAQCLVFSWHPWLPPAHNEAHRFPSTTECMAPSPGKSSEQHGQVPAEGTAFSPGLTLCAGYQGGWVLGESMGRGDGLLSKEGGWSPWFETTVLFWRYTCPGLAQLHKYDFALEPMLLLRRNHTEPSCGGKKMHSSQPEFFIGFYVTLAGVNKSACYYTLHSSHMVGHTLKWPANVDNSLYLSH
jgi:hypothetical protein